MNIIKLFKKKTSNGISYTVAVVQQTKKVPPAKYTPNISKESAKNRHKAV